MDALYSFVQVWPRYAPTRFGIMQRIGIPRLAIAELTMQRTTRAIKPFFIPPEYGRPRMKKPRTAPTIGFFFCMVKKTPFAHMGNTMIILRDIFRSYKNTPLFSNVNKNGVNGVHANFFMA